MDYSAEINDFINDLSKLEPQSSEGVWTLLCCGLVVPRAQLDYRYQTACTRCVAEYTLFDESKKCIQRYEPTKSGEVKEGWSWDAPKISKDRFQLIVDSTCANGGTVHTRYSTSTAVWSLQERWDTVHLIIESLTPWTRPNDNHLHHAAFGDLEVYFLKQSNMFERYREVLVIAQNHFNTMTRLALNEIAQRMSSAGQCLSIGF